MKSFYSYSFGCRVNQAEKEALDRQLGELGYQWTEGNPDLYIINTCSVTHKAEREAKQMIYRVKREYPDTKLVVTGCAATNWLKQGIKMPEVDFMIDNQSKEFIARLVDKNVRQPISRIQHLGSKIKYLDKYERSGRAIVKLQDGCQRFCTYCIVPYLRGLPKSIPIQTLIQQAKELGNLQELILTAINTEAYGYDSKERFIDLLTAIFEQTTVPRLSFGSIHPWSINDQFLQFYANHPQANRLVNFFHIPLQSGSNKMLGLMKRGYTREEFVDKLQRLDAVRPFTFIGTDVIVGFLEETDADFADTYQFMKETPISKFHVFRFSKRQHTAAFYLAKRLQEPTADQKAKRAKALADLSRQKYATFLKSHVGHTFDALFLEKRDGGWQHVVLSNQIPAVIKTKHDLTAKILPVRIEKLSSSQLQGSLTQ